mmetsp:Transcript_25745/g.48059  ORF Transcript_25745/g.48059 Transcript_25745/m.48059 type:complete len:80 (-) Transcript_25745:133-372(-)
MNRLYSDGKTKFESGTDMQVYDYNAVFLAIKVSTPTRLDLAQNVLKEMLTNGISPDAMTRKRIEGIEKACGKPGSLPPT